MKSAVWKRAKHCSSKQLDGNYKKESGQGEGGCMRGDFSGGGGGVGHFTTVASASFLCSFFIGKNIVSVKEQRKIKQSVDGEKKKNLF